ncbi:thiaminase/transcriptional activator TenA [Alicyclobacillus sacchari]|uniref:Aminopyrimidine aminohydrolase n=1 Tax=Alicyclobacillus sacchari TaxID=392010 RepID=A0A4R8LNU7_9BACL|nr:thiaminase II [Alicyclobacillus sacchari]TDY47952.1 thiaminase/transcriptional activator TenA [Alicyclobacillus sacchari]GMA56069.1 aminopyrimidine aminohydrolase [Alicyclobacillus sacchari]
MRFSTELYEASRPIFAATLAHPFLQGIAQGELPRDALVRYVQQDELYLTTYCRVYAKALACADTDEHMRDFYDRVGLLLEGEHEAHENLLQVAAVRPDERGAMVEKLPTLHHYESHLLAVAATSDFGAIIAAILPCHWLYVDLARRIVDEVQPTADHPFSAWLSFYASDDMKDSLDRLLVMVDKRAALANTEARAFMRAAYMESCYLEYRFFDMAYRGESWLPQTTANGALAGGRDRHV